MKKLTAFLMMLALVASFSVMAQEAPATEEAAPALETEETCDWRPFVSLSADWATKYMCDGKVVNPNAMVFLDAFVELKGFYVDLWAAMDMSHYNRPDGGSFSYKNDRQYRAEEIDYVIGYNHTFDIFDFSPVKFDIAYKYFQYPRAYFDHDEPLDTTIALTNILQSFQDEDAKDALSIGVTWRYDLNWYTNYFWFDTTYSRQLTDKLSASISGKLYWGTKSKMRAVYGLNRDVISSFQLKGALNYALTENVSVGAWVDCGWAVDHEIRDAWKASDINNEENFRTGVNVSFCF